MRFLRKILGVTWKDRVPDFEVLQRTKLVTVENIMFARSAKSYAWMKLNSRNSYSTTSCQRANDRRGASQSLVILKARHISGSRLDALTKDQVTRKYSILDKIPSKLAGGDKIETNDLIEKY